MELTPTIAMYKEGLDAKENLFPTIIVTKFDDKEGSIIAEIDPRALNIKSPHYIGTKAYLDAFIESHPPDEICVIYVGAIFSTKESSLEQENPNLIFQVQTKEGINMYAFDIVDNDLDSSIIISPNPINHAFFKNNEEIILPFISKTAFLEKKTSIFKKLKFK
jgi:hypothetical protein